MFTVVSELAGAASALPGQLGVDVRNHTQPNLSRQPPFREHWKSVTASGLTAKKHAASGVASAPPNVASISTSCLPHSNVAARACDYFLRSIQKSICQLL